MKTKAVCLFLFGICFISTANAAFLSDTLRKNKARFIEIKTGGVVFLDGRGNNYGITDHVSSTSSENINFSIGKRIKKISLGFNLDYTKYNLSGGVKTVGWDFMSSNSTKTSYRYYITQSIQFYNLSFGLTSTYNLRFKKLLIDLGPSVYFILGRSQLYISDTYSGIQPNNPYSFQPMEVRNSKDDGSGDIHHRKLIPYAGFNLDLGYQLNSRFSIKIFNALYYDLFVNIRGDGYGYDTLPLQSIYSIEKQIWLNSGIGITFNY